VPSTNAARPAGPTLVANGDPGTGTRTPVAASIEKPETVFVAELVA
jgi:hypothetical protein